MKRKILEVLAVIVFTAVIFFMGYIEDIKQPLLSGNFILDVPENYATEIATIKAVRLEERVNNITSIEGASIQGDVNQMLDRLPSGVLNMLESYTFIVTDKNITALQGALCLDFRNSNDEVAAFVNYDIKVVVLNVENALYRDSIYHEIGHIVDNSMETISESEEFLQIYEKECSAFKEHISAYKIYREIDGVMYLCEASGSYCVSTPAEYFAEAFNRYYINSTSMKDYCPETYAFMDELVKSLKKQ